jgi:predicted O-linked N-acetylglucosamine transferase (SPINDLY family)
MDFRVTDDLADPPGASEQFHTERLVRPFPSFLCYAPTDAAPEPAPPPFLEAGQVTFGSFNNRRKITTDVLALWASVLEAVPGSRLLMKAQALIDPACRDDIATTLVALGVSRDRFDLVPLTRSHFEHLEAYGRIDVALDTFPYNGTTTTMEALWMGVPVVTLSGSTHRSRVGRSILTNVGLAGLVASSRDEFVDVARRLATDTERLRELRGTLRSTVGRSPVMDARGFGDALDAAYRQMWREWCAERCRA